MIFCVPLAVISGFIFASILESALDNIFRPTGTNTETVTSKNSHNIPNYISNWPEQRHFPGTKQHRERRATDADTRTTRNTGNDRPTTSLKHPSANPASRTERAFR
jgi:hypothetical protein